MRSITAFSFAGLLLWGSLTVNAETNAVMGRLGYPIGTQLIIEGRMKRPMKEYSLTVEKVNHKELRKPVIISLGITCGPFIDFSNTVVRHKGVERMDTVLPAVDSQTGLPVEQQQAAGTFFRFEIQKVIKPDDLTVENGYWKRKSEQTSHGDVANAPAQRPDVD